MFCAASDHAVRFRHAVVVAGLLPLDLLYHELNRLSLSISTKCGFTQLEGTPSCHTIDKHHLLAL